MKTVEKSTSKPCNNPFLGFVAFAKSIDSKVNNGLSVSCYTSSTLGYTCPYSATLANTKNTLLQFFSDNHHQPKYCDCKRNTQMASYTSSTLGYTYPYLATLHPHLATLPSTFGYLSSTFGYPFKSESVAPTGKTGHPLKLLKLFKKLVINQRVLS